MFAAIDTNCSTVISGDVRMVFAEYREELEWLATLLTGDEKVAQACVIDACSLSESGKFNHREWLLEYARLATVRSAVETQRRRIAELASVYHRRPCLHNGHPTLSMDCLELLVTESDRLIAKMDVLARCAVVICGVEKRSFVEAACLLGIDVTSVESAYCAGFEFLEVIGCENLQHDSKFAAVRN